ncbi:hypothetical protein C0992_000314 [Termitomyces sp. T32_za158]|nr:hypothetical protein C0992_000314 [Termitomyces sp. T32_za158]
MSIKDDVPVFPPSALSMAKFITNFDGISYPEGIQSPDPSLSRNAKDGLLRYDRPFLLQFMEVCKANPEGLPDLVTTGLEPGLTHAQENFPMSRGGSGRHKGGSSAPSRQGSLGLGITGFKPGQSMFPTMGNFGSGSKLSSEDRFAASTRAVSAGSRTYGQPATPTQTHAVPHHPAPPSFTSPPPTPSTATSRLNPTSSTFVPGSRKVVTLENPDGHEVDITSITKSNPSASPSPAPHQGYRQSSPSSPATTPRRPASIRLESEEQRLKRLADEEKKKAEAKAEARKEREEEQRKKKEGEDRIRERERLEEEQRIREEERQSMFPTIGNFGSGSKRTSDNRFAASTWAVSMDEAAAKLKAEPSKSYNSNAPGSPLLGSGKCSGRKLIDTKDHEAALVDLQVRALLNKLSMENFDSISDQIVECANWSEDENDGKTLMQVIALVFEKATDEAMWSEMYARLCRKMMEKLSPAEEFEHGWAVKEAIAAAAAKRAAEDPSASHEEGNAEVALYSDEYYAAQKAKRRGLGLIKFIGELFKLQMLMERMMHTCLKKLLGNVDQPEEEDLESCCKLLMTIGSMLDTPKATNHMMAYFSRILELRNSALVSARVQFMLQDVLDLREKKWVSRNVVAAPSTIAQVHENAAKEKAAQEKKDAFSRPISKSRGGSRRGGERDDYPPANGADGWANGADGWANGADGWAVAGGGGGGNAPRPPSKAGDLSNFGKINKNTSMSFGPSTVFAKKAGGDGKRESVSSSSSSASMFSMFSHGDASLAELQAPKPQRKRLVLAPHMKPTTDEVAIKYASLSLSPSVGMTGELAIKKIEEDIKEFLAMRNFDEAEVCLMTLPGVYHFRLVEKLTAHAIEAKEVEAQVLAELFARAVEKELVKPKAFEAGFLSIAEIIDDVAIDVPKAFLYFATVVKSAGLDEEQKVRLASKLLDERKLLDLLS